MPTFFFCDIASAAKGVDARSERIFVFGGREKKWGEREMGTGFHFALNDLRFWNLPAGRTVSARGFCIGNREVNRGDER